MTGFERVYEEHFGDVYRYIRRLSGNDHVAEEITAETFFKAMRAIDRFRGECELRVWLCGIAKNCYLSYLKRAKRQEPFGEAEQVDGGETPEERVLRSDEAARIRRLLHELPEVQREVFMWRVYAELSFREIGQMFGKSENWACVTYHRARKAIRERLEAENNEK